MSDKVEHIQEPRSISIQAADRLSITVNTKIQIPSVTPRWILKILPWVNVNTGIYRINRVKCNLDHAGTIQIGEDEKGKPKISADNLKQFYLFRELPESTLEELSNAFVLKTVKAQETIIHFGEPGDNFYIIVEGTFEVLSRGSYGKDFVLSVLESGEHFGEIALLREQPRDATVIARTDGTLFFINKKAFAKFLEQPKLRKKIEQSAILRTHELENFTAFGERKLSLKAGQWGEPALPKTYISYDENPTEVHLSVIQTIVGMHTRISDVYNVPYNQLEEQIRVAIESILEKQESEIINNKEFGLLHVASPRETITTRNGAPTPDDLDNLLSIVWKKPSFFLAHPKAIAAFGRECTLRGVPPPTATFMGGTFITWRGVPLIPTEKLEIVKDKNNPKINTTNILLIRVGEKEQGVIGLHKNDLPGQTQPGMSVHFMGIDEHSIGNYLLTKYFAVAVLVPDALAVLNGVEVGHYHE